MKFSRKLALLSLSALLIGLFGVLSVQAAPPAPANFTVAGGQSATVQVNVFCLDFGKDFPTNQSIQPSGPADAKLSSALAYAIDKGYDQSDPRQVQLALWYLRDNTFHTNAGESKDKAQEIIDNANNAPAVAAGSGTALADALKNNQVTVTATGVKPLKSGEYYGTATLEIKNSGSNSLNLSLAPGTTFVASGANFQSLIAYPTGAQGSTAGAQATTAAATTAATTTAAATTAAATTVAAATTAATTTTAAAATTAATTTAATTTVAATTAAATTVAATTAPATTTTAPTTVAATTVAPTTVAAATTAAAAQGGAAVTPASGLPASGLGGSSDSGNDALLPLSLLILLLVAMTAGTFLLVLKGRRS